MHLNENERFKLFFALLLGLATLVVGHFMSVEDVELLEGVVVPVGSVVVGPVVVVVSSVLVVVVSARVVVDESTVVVVVSVSHVTVSM